METLTINNFKGSLTRVFNGDINSGLAKYSTSFGYEPFGYPYQLRWQDKPVQIDSGATVIADLILRMKGRVESGTPYVYGVGYAGKFYKITVNANSPSLVASTSLNLKYGGGLEFYKGSTEKVYIGHDSGVVKIGFDGSSQTNLTGASVSWVTNVPRPIKHFLGKLYVGNDTNLAEIDTTEDVITASKLNPAIPANWHIKDLDISRDGVYLVILATRMIQSDIQTSDPTDISSNQESVIALWNGSNDGITTYESIPSFSMTSFNTSSQNEFLFGYDIAGAVLRNNSEKILSLIGCKSPLPGAIDFNGNLIGAGVPETSNGHLVATNWIYGSLDSEFGIGFWKNYKATATGLNTDVMVVGAVKIVSSLTWGSNSYAPLVDGKYYYSTYETGGTPTAKFYYHITTGAYGAESGDGVYETQNQLFGKKIEVKAIRVYCEPTAVNNGFQMDLIGCDGNILTGGTYTYDYSAGGDITQNQGALDLIEFTCQTAPTYSLGLRITNTGTTNMKIHKIEIDWTQAK